ncbi:hypothetical protein [Deinococcus ruber]|uniref:Uncharacterized protein n=1 Tax=Deinococcus ruber TaxID=1848197 RepID=A0A918F1W3_9DEIO|nr:hypothetical protein [Deinococcus ruber]GGR00301.1 hypothetical protein GCM10008957_11330 [Deinococcus ruber]
MPTIDTANVRRGFASIKITIGTTEVIVKSISYGDGMDRGDIEGNARMSLGVSEGMYKADEATADLYMDDFDALMDAMKDGYYEDSFEVVVVIGEGAGKTRTDTLKGCRMTKRAASDQSGPDALTRSVSFKPLYITVNGIAPLKNMPTGTK